MGLFSKKKEEKSLLPDLPESSPELPKLPEFSGGNLRLKSDVPINNEVPSNNLGMPPANNQSAIKDEISGNMGMNVGVNVSADGMQKSQFDPLPRYEGAGMPAKIVAEPSYITEDDHQQVPVDDEDGPRTFEMQEDTSVKSYVKSAKPIYIRLDKFKAGLESFEDIKGKIEEIEDLLKSIKEIKDKEERELEEWEREIQVVKARIEQIDNDVFKNVE